jgi:hypothetical protein
MAIRVKTLPQPSSRVRPTAATMLVSSVTFALLAAAASLLGENYRPDPAFLDPFRAPTRDEAIVIYPAEYALKSADDNDVVFLGDSTCRCSIDPAEFQKASGLVAYNLGSLGGLGIDSYRMILQLYLEHHPSPRAAVLAVTPDDLDVEASQAAGGWPRLFRWSYGESRETLHVPEDLESVKFFARRGFGIGHELWANSRRETRFDPRVEPLVGVDKETYFTLEEKVRKARGFWALGGKHFATGTDPPNKPVVNVAPQWRVGFRELAKTAQAGGVSLVVRLVPMVDTVKTDYQPVRAWLRDIQSQYPGVIVLHPEILLYDPELCWDYQHLNADGVRKFSRSLANDISEVLSRESKRRPDGR